MVAEKKPSPEADRPQNRPSQARVSSLKSWGDLIERDPQRPGEDRARTRGSGIAVWAIIGYLRALNPEFTEQAIQQAARDFNIQANEVEAAIAYYQAHRDVIDARLKINSAAVA
jgi:uncharacterized protein (DUF433 family)